MNRTRYKYWLSSIVLGMSLYVVWCADLEPADFLDAIVSEDVSTMETLLEQGIDLNEPLEFDGRLPLMHATVHSKTEVVKFLIENGADIDAFDSEGNTALVTAAFLGSVEIVQALIDGGANLLARRNLIGEDVLAVLDTNWESTSEYANEIYEIDLIQEEIETGREQLRPILLHAREQAAKEDVWFAIAIGDLDIVKIHGENVDNIATMVHPEERTPILHSAVNIGHLEIVKYLLQAGADVESRNEDGSTPLFGAVMFGHEDIVRELIENGADVTVTDNSGNDLQRILELDWALVSLFGRLMGLSLDKDELEQSRETIKELIRTHKRKKELGLEARMTELEARLEKLEATVRESLKASPNTE